MVLDKIILVLDNIALIYMGMIYTVFFTFIIFAALEFNKRERAKSINEIFEFDNPIDYTPV